LKFRLLKSLKTKFEDVKTMYFYNKCKSVNLYFQDESRFGLMTLVGRCLTSKGVKPIVKYKHAFKNTYLYGSYSTINGDSFTFEIEGTTSEIFYNYLLEFSKYKPEELKIIMIDNARFHSLSNYETPSNIRLINIPAYSPELNPAEKIWAYIKSYFKNKVFEDLDEVKQWLHQFLIKNMKEDIVKSITHDKFYMEIFKDCFR